VSEVLHRRLVVAEAMVGHDQVRVGVPWALAQDALCEAFVRRRDLIILRGLHNVPEHIQGMTPRQLGLRAVRHRQLEQVLGEL
jgi:hypothetical protein